MPAVGLLTKFFKKNTIATLNGTIFSRNSEWYDLLRHKPTIKQSIFGTLLLMRNTFMMRFIKEIKLYTVLCPYRRDVYVREGLSKERIFVIPNILDLGFKTEEREIEEKIRILYVGNKNWLNGLDILLKAYSQLSKENFELVVVGVKESDAKPYPDAKNPINFLGRIPYKKLPSIYANSDIFVNPFRSPEPVSRTVMEAMQSGIPVIATGTPSYSPIIRDGIDGILVYPCTPNKLVRALETLIEDPGLRRRMGERAKKRVHEICNPERIAKLYLDVYTKTLNVSN